MAAVGNFRITIIYNRYFESGRECVSVNEWERICFSQRTMAFDLIFPFFIDVVLYQVPKLSREDYLVLVLLPQLFSHERANGHTGNVASFETCVAVSYTSHSRRSSCWIIFCCPK